jgi:hypothetical protein
VEGIHEPVTRSLHRTLRRAVLEHAGSERRRIFAPLLHVGTPGGPQALFAPGPLPATDHALRTDVMAALLRRTSAIDGRLVWLTRAGGLDLQDVDAAWLAAARAAGAEAGVPVTMVVVTRHGWRDPRSGAGRTWKRLRAR